MSPQNTSQTPKTRRDFLCLTAGALGAVGACATLIPLLQSMNPSGDVLSQSTVDVDIQHLKPGESLTAMWRGKPIFVKRRTPQEIEAVRNISLKDLKDPETDQARTKNPEWLVVIGICTHLGCIPSVRTSIAPQEKGWLCACHGSIYDPSGRILQGPAPRNLEVPVYAFINQNTAIRIGESL